mmetsp:Transcript_37029/g.93003  ORF Transcript_37029/g.93003 Transcript_37029/m.93003 type:complete len:152 (+) Transcript_37029:197-652(+)
MEEQDDAFGTPGRSPMRKAGESEADSYIRHLEKQVLNQRETIASLREDGSSSKKEPTQDTITKNNKTQNLESKIVETVRNSNNIVSLVTNIHAAIQLLTLGNALLALPPQVKLSETGDGYDLVLGTGTKQRLLGSDLKCPQNTKGPTPDRV